MDNGIAAIEGGYAIGGYTGSSGFDYLDGLHVPTLGGNDVYVVTLAEQGNANWAGLIGGTGNDNLSGFHSDEEGGVLLAGFSYSTTFDCEPTRFVENEVSNVGSYVVRLQPRRPGGQVILLEHDFVPTNWSTHWVQAPIWIGSVLHREKPWGDTPPKLTVRPAMRPSRQLAS